MYNKIEFLRLGYSYQGEIIVGEIRHLETRGILKFYYSYYENIFYPLNDKKSLMVDILYEDGIIEYDDGLLTFNEKFLKFIEDKLEGTAEITNFVA